jgi:predicted alpha/beta superfamily hydrolase
LCSAGPIRILACSLSKEACPVLSLLARRVLPLLLLLGLCLPLHAATVRIHYDTGWGNSISIRGSAAPLSWSSGAAATWSSGNVWVWNGPSSMGAFEIKPLVNDRTWSTGGNYRVPSGDAVVDIYPFFGPSVGRVEKVPGFWSPQLGNARALLIYLPPSYNENRAKHYPVVYMHDGQNLFDARTAFGGVEWQVDETMNRLVGEGRVREAIVVGVENTARRIDEYTPSRDPGYGGGEGDVYLDFLVQDIMPWVEARYRTLSGPRHRVVMGSSLGGLISCYAAWTRSGDFGAAGCLSSSFWWNEQLFTRQVEAATGKAPVRFYVDSGGQNDGAPATARMRDALEADGHEHGVDLWHWYEPSHGHNEAAWAARLHRPLEALLPFHGELELVATGTAGTR